MYLGKGIKLANQAKGFFLTMIYVLVTIVFTTCFCFVFVWFFVGKCQIKGSSKLFFKSEFKILTLKGNGYVYSKYSSVQLNDPKNSDNCDRSLFLYSFWTLTIAYIFIGLALIGEVSFLIIKINDAKLQDRNFK